jgi:hypothetical protein
MRAWTAVDDDELALIASDDLDPRKARVVQRPFQEYCAIAAALSFLGAAAFAQDVKVDFDKDANFGALKTFTVKVGTSWDNPIGEKRVVGEIEEALGGKGWTKAEADHGATEKQKTLNTFYSGGYGGYGWRGMGGMGMGTATTTASEYLVGTLVVDIFDAKSKQLVFRGTATDELSDKPEKNVKKLDKATSKMFKDFPPGSAKK